MDGLFDWLAARSKAPAWPSQVADRQLLKTEPLKLETVSLKAHKADR